MTVFTGETTTEKPGGSIGMAKPAETIDKAKRTGPREGVSTTDRTRVIMLSQIVTIVALIVLWSILRNRQSSTKVAPSPT